MCAIDQAGGGLLGRAIKGLRGNSGGSSNAPSEDGPDQNSSLSISRRQRETDVRVASGNTGLQIASRR